MRAREGLWPCAACGRAVIRGGAGRRLLAGLLTRTDGAGRGGEEAAGVRDRVLETMNAFLAAAMAKRQEVDLPMLRDVERALRDLGDGREGEDGPAAEATRRIIADIASQDSV